MTGLRNNHSITPLRVFLVLLLAHEVTTGPFQPVSSSCIYWDALDLYSTGLSEKLHCILDENEQPGIVNVTWKWVRRGLCPYFDRHSSQINVKLCHTELGKCPEQEIYSFQGVKYSACYRPLNRTTDLQLSNTTSERIIHYYIESSATLIVFLVLILLAVLGLYVHEKLRKLIKVKKEKNTEDPVGLQIPKQNKRISDTVDEYLISCVNSSQTKYCDEKYSEESLGLQGQEQRSRNHDTVDESLIPGVNSSQTKYYDDENELKIMCLGLIMAQLLKESANHKDFASNIPEDRREHMRIILQTELNRLFL